MQWRYSFIKLFIFLYMYFYGWYQRLWEMLIDTVGPLYIIYHFDGNKFVNITFGYYLNWWLSSRYHTGSYFCKKLLRDRTNHFTFTGKLDIIRTLTTPDIPSVKRHNIMLYLDSKPREVNLNILDNYVTTMKHLNHSHTIRNSLILKQLGLECSHVQITMLRPFSKVMKGINDMKLEELYVLWS